MRRLLCLLLAVLVAAPAAAARLPKLVLAGPPAAVSFPLVRMADAGLLGDVAEQVEFVLWRDPDQLRLLALEGRAHVLAMPTNVAANLYNKRVPLQLLNVSTWGILWLVSRDPEIRTLADLKGRELAVPFRADMPDIILGLLAKGQGIDLREDLTLRYVASPMDAMQLLIMRQVDHALLAEPAVSMALRKTKSFPVSVVAPDLHRALDLQEAWGKTFATAARLPQAGIVVMGEAREPALAGRLAAAYAEALAWCQAHTVECGAAVARRVPMMMAEAVADSIPGSRLEAVSAQDARAELEAFLGKLLDKSPGLVGGRLPDEGFYARP